MLCVKIHTPFIKLGDFMKFAGMVENGAEAKLAIQTGKVYVNREICYARGKKLKSGDIITYNAQDIAVG